MHDYTSWCFKKNNLVFFLLKSATKKHWKIKKTHLRTIKITAWWHYFQEKYLEILLFFLHSNAHIFLS